MLCKGDLIPSLEDKILVPKPPQNCATCGDPVDGLYCRSCAFVRKCLNEEEGRRKANCGRSSGLKIDIGRFPFAMMVDEGLLPLQSHRFINQGIEELVPIPSESEGISDGVCDVPLCDNPTPFKAFKVHSEIVVNSNGDDTSSDDDDFEDIEYVEASPPDLEIVSLEEVNDVD
ncbi:hypothetical protein Tco_0637279 [Tanacetum coccineum]